MTRPITRIYQGDGTFIDREMNDVEFNQYQSDQEIAIARRAEIKAKAAKRAELLSRLGITEEEARILLG